MINFAEIKVNCLKIPYTFKTMKVRYSLLPNGNYMYSPVNGCEFESKDKNCEICKLNLSTYFMKLQTEFNFSVSIDPLHLDT